MGRKSMHDYSIFTLSFMAGSCTRKFRMSNQGTLGETRNRVRKILKQVNAEEVLSHLALINGQNREPTDTDLPSNQTSDDNNRVRCWLENDVAQDIPIELLQDEKCALLLGFSNVNQNSNTDHDSIEKEDDSGCFKLSADDIL